MKTKSRKSLINFSSAVFYKVLVIVVGLLLPRLFITSYGSEINGFQASVKQIFTYIALLEAGVGAATIQSLYGPVAKGDRDKVNSYMSAASRYYNKIGIIYFVILAALAVIYSFLIPVERLSRIMVFVYIIVSGALTGINFFYFAKLKLLISAEGDQYIVTNVTTVTYLISSTVKIAFIYAGFSIVAVEAAYLLINILATVCYYILAKKKYPWLDLKAKPDKSGMKQKNSVMIHKISHLVFQNVDVLLLTLFCNLEVVSIYTMYKMVVNMVTSIVSEIGNSVNFVFGQKFNSSDDKTAYIELIDTFNVYYSAIAFGLYTVTYVLILPFLRIYTNGLDINYIFDWLPVLYICMEFLTVGREAMVRTIDVAGHFKKTQTRALIETIINLVSTVILIVVFKAIFGDIGGIYGALMGTIVALLYRTVDINVYANKKILNRSSLKAFSVMLINAGLFAITSWLMNFIDIKADNYIQFFAYGVCITPVVLAMFLCVHSVLNVKEFRYASAFIKKKLKLRVGGKK